MRADERWRRGGDWNVIRDWKKMLNSSINNNLIVISCISWESSLLFQLMMMILLDGLTKFSLLIQYWLSEEELERVKLVCTSCPIQLFLFYPFHSTPHFFFFFWLFCWWWWCGGWWRRRFWTHQWCQSSCWWYSKNDHPSHSISHPYPLFEDHPGHHHYFYTSREVFLLFDQKQEVES